MSVFKIFIYQWHLWIYFCHLARHLLFLRIDGHQLLLALSLIFNLFLLLLLLQFMSTAFSGPNSYSLATPSICVPELLLFLDSDICLNYSNYASVSQAFLLTANGNSTTWKSCCQGWPKTLTVKLTCLWSLVQILPNWSHFPEGRGWVRSNPSLFKFGHPDLMWRLEETLWLTIDE